jgi:hypothetical protein
MMAAQVSLVAVVVRAVIQAMELVELARIVAYPDRQQHMLVAAVVVVPTTMEHNLLVV